MLYDIGQSFYLISYSVGERAVLHLSSTVGGGSLVNHWSLSAATHAPFHASVLRPASQVGPMHKTAGKGKLINGALLSLMRHV